MLDSGPHLCASVVGGLLLLVQAAPVVALAVNPTLIPLFPKLFLACF
jgi:hypothetical protein